MHSLMKLTKYWQKQLEWPRCQRPKKACESGVISTFISHKDRDRVNEVLMMVASLGGFMRMQPVRFKGDPNGHRGRAVPNPG
jgi:hypothetical protein